MNTSILDYVLERLQSRARPWTVIARETEIPYDTLKKIARRVTPNPGVLHVQRLHDYFKKQEAEERRQSDRRKASDRRRAEPERSEVSA